MSKDAAYTARWFAKKIRETANEPAVDKLADELADAMSAYLGEAPAAAARTDKNDSPMIDEPVDTGKPTIPDFKNDPKFPHRYPLNTRFDADGDAGGSLIGGKPEYIVVHHTMSYNTDGTVSHFKRNLVDVHFVIGHKGEVVQMVDCNRSAAHAGESRWNGHTGLNSRSIGIEVVNIGPLVKTPEGFLDGYNVEKKKKGKPFTYWKGAVRERDAFGYKYWEPFTPAQEQAVISICLWAMKTYGIKLENICGHYECSPGRKNDPAGGFSHGSMVDFRKALGAALKQAA